MVLRVNPATRTQRKKAEGRPGREARTGRRARTWPDGGGATCRALSSASDPASRARGPRACRAERGRPEPRMCFVRPERRGPAEPPGF